MLSLLDYWFRPIQEAQSVNGSADCKCLLRQKWMVCEIYIAGHKGSDFGFLIRVMSGLYRIRCLIAYYFRPK